MDDLDKRIKDIDETIKYLKPDPNWSDLVKDFIKERDNLIKQKENK